MFYEYRGKRYPNYLREKNAASYILPFAKKFCHGKGLDIGAGKYCLPGAQGVDPNRGNDRQWDAMSLPPGKYDYIFSSHCLEHLEQPRRALEHWVDVLVQGGVLMLYLPHPDNEEWHPANTKGHKHIWHPDDLAEMLYDLGLKDVIITGKDLLWSFSVVGFRE